MLFEVSRIFTGQRDNQAGKFNNTIVLNDVFTYSRGIIIAAEQYSII